MKNTLYIFCFIILLSSCSGTKFLKRKYTSGLFIENKNVVSSPKKEKVTQDYQALVDSNIVLSNTFCLSQNDSIQPITNMFYDTCKSEECAVTIKKDYYSSIIKHNTIFVDTNKKYSSLNKDFEIVLGQKFYKETQVFTKNIKRAHKHSDVSFWSYLFDELGKAFIQILVAAAIIGLVVWCIYMFFMPTALFWLLFSLAIVIASIILLAINNPKPTSKQNSTKNNFFKALISGFELSSISILDLAISILLSV